MSYRHNYILAAISALIVSLIAGCGETVVSIDDVITKPGGRAKLIARVERESILGLRADVDDIEVEFYVGNEKVGHDDTNKDGRASIKYGHLSVDDARVEAVVKLEDQTLRASARVFEWNEDVVAIAIDIDNTIARTDYEGLVLDETDDDSHPIKRARKTLRNLAGDFQILYLTARPRFLLEKTRRWLEDNAFPPGPLVVAPGLRETMRPEAYKRDALKRYRDDWPNILIGIGDKRSDAAAYGENDMLTLIVSDEESEHCRHHALRFRKWKQVAEFFEANRSQLADVEELEDIIDGKVMIRIAVNRYKDD